MTHRIEVLGHRGARGLFPENTVEGFLAASSMGVEAFELDVGMTADGVVVVHHDLAPDADIARDASGAWISGSEPAIHAMTYLELGQYDVGRFRPGSPSAQRFPDQVPKDGARIPTLASVLAALPAARFLIEIKTDPGRPDHTASAAVLADATLGIVDNAGASSRVTIEAFDWRVQRHVRRVRPDIRLAWLTSAESVRHTGLWWDGLGLPQSVPAAVANEGGPIWAPDYTALTEAQIQEAHSLGLTVLTWTVNRPADMRRLIGWGVDGLITDRPDLAMVQSGDGPT